MIEKKKEKDTNLLIILLTISCGFHL